MSVQTLDKINAAINQYNPNYYNDPTASSGVNAINQTASSTLQSTLAALKSKISDSLANYGQQQAAIPAKYQPDYNQHATQAALNLRNVIEGAANRGDNGGMGQMQQLAVGTTQQNADASTDTSKNADLSNIQNAINQTDINGVNDLNSAIATNNTDRIRNVITQQGNEAAAAYKVQQDQQAAAEAEANRQNAVYIQQLRNEASTKATSTAAKAKIPTYTDIFNDATKNFIQLNPDTGLKTITDPTALQNYISDNPYLTDEQKNQMFNSFPAGTSYGMSLGDLIAAQSRSMNSELYGTSGSGGY